jgi:hypothetical protein
MRVIVRKERPPDAPRLRSPTPLTSSTFDEFEGGRRVAGHVRVAFQVRDAASTTGTLVMAGAQLIAEPTPTPWRSLNSRLDAALACSSPCSPASCPPNGTVLGVSPVERNAIRGLPCRTDGGRPTADRQRVVAR